MEIQTGTFLWKQDNADRRTIGSVVDWFSPVTGGINPDDVTCIRDALPCSSGFVRASDFLDHRI